MNEFLSFVSKIENQISALSKELNINYFEATVTGSQEKFQKVSELQLKITQVFSNKTDFEKLKSLKKFIPEDEQILTRIYKILYNEFAANQFDESLHEEIIKLSTKIEEKFSTYRAKVDDKVFTDNQIDEILKASVNNSELQNIWEASKQIGEQVAEDVIKLVQLRNQSAKLLGYDNFHQMSLELSEQNSDDVLKLFNELDELTNNKFQSLKSEMDDFLADRYSIQKNKLMPWHYQDKFFQQGPKLYSVDFDKYFENRDIVKITKEYFSSMNLSADEIIEKSDLYEKENKYQHAYCMNIDREGDIRIVCNVKPNHRWMSTMLHETGHAVYDKYISEKLPWILRTHAHIFTTEAIAMMLGRMASNPFWLKDVLNIGEDEINEIKSDAEKSLMLEQLIFSRWVQVVFRFEKAMYENPKQNLNELWWNLVNKYQLINKPENRDKPDWASKIHIALYPAYYHNYILGELLASQLQYFISNKVLNKRGNARSFYNEKNVGDYLQNLFFGYGAIYSWNELIEKATGEKLNPKYYADEFCK